MCCNFFVHLFLVNPCLIVAVQLFMEWIPIKNIFVYHKKIEILPTNPPINICINWINNRLVFKIKDVNKLELQAPETMKLFGSPKKLIDKTENGENVPSLEVVEAVLVQYNLDILYQPSLS